VPPATKPYIGPAPDPPIESQYVVPNWPQPDFLEQTFLRDMCSFVGGQGELKWGKEEKEQGSSKARQKRGLIATCN
jgi:hypothetical protein